MTSLSAQRLVNPLTRLLAVAFAAASCGAACDGAKPPTDGASSSVTEPVLPAKPAPSAPAKDHCVVQMPAVPAPHAQKAASCPPDPGGGPALPRGYVTFSEAPGAPRVEIEIADNDLTRERGLMYRTSMGEERGMIFSWPEESRRTFWMHDTCIPLDMLFIALDGTIAGILEQVPVLSDAARTVPCPAGYVLELNAGYVRAHGILPGQRVRIES